MLLIGCFLSLTVAYHCRVTLPQLISILSAGHDNRRDPRLLDLHIHSNHQKTSDTTHSLSPLAHSGWVLHSGLNTFRQVILMPTCSEHNTSESIGLQILLYLRELSEYGFLLLTKHSRSLVLTSHCKQVAQSPSHRSSPNLPRIYQFRVS